MEKKNLLLNYCISKFLEAEKEFLGISDFKTAMITLITGKHIRLSLHEYNESYRLHLNYPQELLFLLCIESLGEAKSNRLLQSFSFCARKTIVFYPSFYIVDEGLQNHLHYSIYEQMTSEKYKRNFSSKEEIFVSWQENIPQLQMPESCEETQLIDKAWDQLKQRHFYPKLFDVSAKYRDFPSKLQEFFLGLQIYRDILYRSDSKIKVPQENVMEYYQEYEQKTAMAW